MSENLVTFSNLMRDFELSAKAMKKLAVRCGVSPEPFERSLTFSERDKLYDEWLRTSQPVQNPPREEMILIDTCSLLESPGAEIYLENKAPELLKDGKKIIIPLAVINELRNISARKDDIDLPRRARNILDLIRSYKEKGVISVHGEATDGTHADNAFQKIITMFGTQYRITVITQDFNLSQDLLLMGQMRSSGRRKISVKKLDKHGNLIKVALEGRGM